jgi:hypothetical protein
VRSAITLPISETLTTETLIVGAGIAGLSAACSLKSNDFMICELNPQIGGTSDAISINNTFYTQGAHYDWEYGANYGKEGLELLECLNIIRFNSLTNRWDFVDKQYVIPKAVEEACYINGVMKSSAMPRSELRDNLFSLLDAYTDEFPLPTTLIDSKWHHLDQITFFDYLNKYLPLTSDFVEAIDYQLMDDYGGTSKQVSALAGIHYYKCRPYYDKEEPALFSPVEGNFYYAKKMLQAVGESHLYRNHLVFGLKQENNSWTADVFDAKANRRKQVIAKNVVYAGQKHALKYIHPSSYQTFSDVSYTPWVIVNFEMEEVLLENSKWQNDFLSPDISFLGFVDSNVQDTKKNRVLTVYYCFSEIHHYLVQDFEEKHTEIVYNALEKISQYYGKDVSKYVKKAYIKLLGHAMPMPKVGYLTKQRKLVHKNLAFAGVDTGRLPVLFDAMDSGIQVVKGLGIKH